MYIFNRKSTVDGVVYNYGDSADHLPKNLIQTFLLAKLVSEVKRKSEQPVAEITREDKFYNVSLNCVRLNAEPFKTKKAVEQFCKDNSLNYEYTQ